MKQRISIALSSAIVVMSAFVASEALALTAIQARAACWREMGIPNPYKVKGADQFLPQINTCVAAKMKGAGASSGKK